MAPGRHTRPARRGGRRARATVLLAALPALLALLVTSTPTATATSSATTSTSTSEPTTALPAHLEELRAAEAVELYGDAAIRPLDDRLTSLISLGDSEISGEGAGDYEPGTDGPDNWCHRSENAAIHHTGIAADMTYNVACSGASTENIRIGGEPQYADELVQSDSLAITARNTRLDTIVLVAGANDDLQFGPVITDCTIRWFLPWQGPCAPEYEPDWQDRVDGLQPKAEGTVADLRTIMSEAGYATEDYRLIVMGYPGPIGPDFEDNPQFPGKLIGGCTGYTSDAAWGRDSAVPAFQEGIRAAAQNSGATYLDASRLFHGHEVCMADSWARGLSVDLSNPFPPDENSVRQSFHPNVRGHAAFASCLTQLHASQLAEASCADPGTGTAQLYPGAWDDHFAPRQNTATSSCVGVTGDTTRNGTPVIGASCDDSRAQGWWQDPQQATLHLELTHDRCLDVPSGAYQDGTELQLHDCHGEDNQTFVTNAGTLSPAAAPELCATLAGVSEPLTLRPCDGSAEQLFT